MSHELHLVGADAADGVRTFPRLTVRYLVNHKKRITMWKNLLNLSDVKLHRKASLLLVNTSAS